MPTTKRSQSYHLALIKVTSNQTQYDKKHRNGFFFNTVSQKIDLRQGLDYQMRIVCCLVTTDQHFDGIFLELTDPELPSHVSVLPLIDWVCNTEKIMNTSFLLLCLHHLTLSWCWHSWTTTWDWGPWPATPRPPHSCWQPPRQDWRAGSLQECLPRNNN